MGFFDRQYLPTQPPKREMLVRFYDGVHTTTLIKDLSYGYYVGYVRTHAESRSFSREQIGSA